MEQKIQGTVVTLARATLICCTAWPVGNPDLVFPSPLVDSPASRWSKKFKGQLWPWPEQPWFAARLGL
jgi:hypothetical protein